MAECGLCNTMALLMHFWVRQYPFALRGPFFTSVLAKSKKKTVPVFPNGIPANKIDHEPTSCDGHLRTRRNVVSLQYFGACRSCASWNATKKYLGDEDIVQKPVPFFLNQDELTNTGFSMFITISCERKTGTVFRHEQLDGPVFSLVNAKRACKE